MFNLDTHLAVHAQALQVRERRTELIANNLANADTPGFKARDIDFRKALANAEAGAAGGNGALHLTTDAGALRYRVPLAPSLDGNTVDVQIEQAAFAENAVRYQATLSFLNSRFRSLMTAITGQ